MIRREVLRSHSEAVATLRVHVQFGRFVSAGPLFVQSDAVGCESEIVIGGSRGKERRSIRRNGRILKKAPGGRDQRGEGGPAIRRVTERNSGSDRSASGESDNADAVGETPQSGACCRTYVTAANPSAMDKDVPGLYPLPARPPPLFFCKCSF